MVFRVSLSPCRVFLNTPPSSAPSWLSPGLPSRAQRFNSAPSLPRAELVQEHQVSSWLWAVQQ